MLTIGLLLVGARLLPASPANSAPTAVPVRSAALPASFGLEMAAVFLLILVTAFFALAEYALITVRRTRIRQLVEEGNRNALLVERLLEQPTRLMATIQAGLTLVTTLSSALAATSAVEPIALWLRGVAALSPRTSETLALLLVTVPVAILTLVIGEIAPKSLAVRHSERLALVLVHPIRWLQTLLTPVVSVLTFLSNIVVRPFGGSTSFSTTAVNEEELKMMVESSAEHGVLEQKEQEMIHSILDFADTVVRKVMTPRLDMRALEESASMEQLVRLIDESGHSRIPIYRGDLDNIVGVVHAKNLLKGWASRHQESVSLQDVMRPAYFIPETKKVDELLAEFRRTKQQLAIARDEYGVTSGLVTIEDLLEEIVGDIQDEYDLAEEPLVQVIDAATTILSGKMTLTDVNDRMGLELPEDEADTIGGFVFGLIGHQAEQDDRVSWDGLDFVVEATDGRRITKVRLVRRSVRLPDRPAGPEGTPAALSPQSHVEMAPDGHLRDPVEISGVETASSVSARFWNPGF